MGGHGDINRGEEKQQNNHEINEEIHRKIKKLFREALVSENCCSH